MPTDAEQLVEELAAGNPWAVRLAEMVALAVRIEPELLRMARLRLLPQADAGAEADLWLSSLVQSRNPAGIVLRKDVSELLTARLALRPTELDAAWEVIETAHRRVSPAIHAEEKLAWLALSHREAEMKELLRSIIATMIQPQRSGLLPWAARALPRLPAGARESEEGQMLAFGVGVRLEEPRDSDVSSVSEKTSTWATWLTPQDVPTVPFGVRLTQGAVELGPPDIPESHRIELPKTTPVLVELSWQQGRKNRRERVRVQPYSVTAIDTGPRIYISCQPQDGTVYSDESARIREVIARYFGEHNIVQRPAGTEYERMPGKEIEEWVSTCDVMLVLVGPQWLRTVGARDGSGLADPLDLAGRELNAARRANLEIIPIYMGDTRAPELIDLPAELYEFSRSLASLYSRVHDHLRELVLVLTNVIQLRTVLGRLYRLSPIVAKAATGEAFEFSPRVPKVHITYHLEVGDRVVLRELPFVVGVLADLAGHPVEPLPPLRQRRFIEIDPFNFDAVMAAIQPRLRFRVPQTLHESSGEELAVELGFQSIRDFEPPRIVNQVASLKAFLSRKNELREIQESLERSEAFSVALGRLFSDPEMLHAVLGKLRSQGAFDSRKGVDSRDATEEAPGRNQLAELLKKVGLEPDEHVIPGVVRVLETVEELKEPPEQSPAVWIEGLLEQMDLRLSAQLRAIYHHPDFQKLEAAWRGLHFLVARTDTSTLLKIKILNVTKKELEEDLSNAPDFEKSGIFKKVYSEPFGVLDGEPFGALLGDFEFSHDPGDVDLLERVSQVAASAHAPFISAASPRLFHMESFYELDKPRDLAKLLFMSPEHRRWLSFRDSDDSRYAVLTLPPILMRLPYGRTTHPVESFNFEEMTEDADDRKHLWGNAAYALCSRLTDAFAKYGWCAAIRGVEGGGVVFDLPVRTYKSGEGLGPTTSPTQVAITDIREDELSNLGFAPLVHAKGTDYAVFFSTPTVHSPGKYEDAAATANARLASRLQYIMAASRFAHYLKAIMRDKVGSFMSLKNAEDYLNGWIANYIQPEEDASQEMRAMRPLKQARIDLEQIRQGTGANRAVVFLQPCYQLDELTLSMRVVVDFPFPARS